MFCSNVDGQSYCLSKSSSRRLVTKSEALEVVCLLFDCIGGVVGLLIA